MKQRRIGLGLSYVNVILNTVIGLFMSSFILRTLGSDEYGLYQMMASFANYLTLLQFGTGTVMTRNIARYTAKEHEKSETDKIVSTIMIIAITLAIILLVISVLFYVSIDSIYSKSLTLEQIAYGKRLFILLTGFLILNFFIQTFNGIAFGFERFSFVKGFSVAKLLIRTIVVVIILQIFPSALYLVIIDVVLDFICLTITILYCIKNFNISIRLSLFSKAIFNESMPFAWAMFLQTIINQANSNVDKFVIGVVLSPERVAVYSVAMYIFSAYSSLSTIPISVYLPKVVKDVSNGLQGKELTDTLISPSRLLVLIGGMILFGFITVGQEFIEIVYGEDYLEAFWICVVIMIPMFINLSNGILVNVLDALGKRMSRSLILMVTTILNIILTIWLINVQGIIGAAIATMIATIIGQVLFMNIYYKRVIGIPVIYMFRRIYKGILASFMVATIIGILAKSLVSLLFLKFILGGCVFVAVLFICMLLFGCTESERKMFLAKLHLYQK